MAIPATPQSLTVIQNGPNSVLLSWENPAVISVRFEIQRSVVGPSLSWVSLATVPVSGSVANSFVYEDEPLPAGGSFYYRVRAIDDAIPTDVSQWTSMVFGSVPVSNPISFRFEIFPAFHFEYLLFQDMTGLFSVNRTGYDPENYPMGNYSVELVFRDISNMAEVDRLVVAPSQSQNFKLPIHWSQFANGELPEGIYQVEALLRANNSQSGILEVVSSYTQYLIMDKSIRRQIFNGAAKFAKTGSCCEDGSVLQLPFVFLMHRQALPMALQLGLLAQASSIFNYVKRNLDCLC